MLSSKSQNSARYDCLVLNCQIVVPIMAERRICSYGVLPWHWVLVLYIQQLCIMYKSNIVDFKLTFAKSQNITLCCLVLNCQNSVTIMAENRICRWCQGRTPYLQIRRSALTLGPDFVDTAIIRLCTLYKSMKGAFFSDFFFLLDQKSYNYLI